MSDGTLKSNLFSITWAVLWAETTYPVFSSEVLHTCRSKSPLSSVNKHFMDFSSCHANSFFSSTRPSYAKKSAPAPPTGKEESSHQNFTSVGFSNLLPFLYESTIVFYNLIFFYQFIVWKYLLIPVNLHFVQRNRCNNLFEQQAALVFCANHY